MTNSFLCGVVSACDVVAEAGNGVLLREIIKSCGTEEVLKEIMRNGLEKTKQLARLEFKEAIK